MKKKILAAAVIAGMSTLLGGYLSASAAETTTLQEVVVNADKYRVRGNESVIKPLGLVADEVSDVGILGQKDALDTPFSSMTLSHKSLEYFGSPAKGPTDMLTLNPAVRDNSTSLYNDISIRGFKINGHQMFLNGIPGMLDQQHATDVYIDKATVIAGPNLGISGTMARDSVAGTVIFTSRKAQEKPNADVTFTYRGGESFQEKIDVGTRFGTDKRWGIRVMADNIDGDTVIDGENIKQRDFFVNIDQKTTYSKSNLLVGYNYTDQHASPHTFSFDSKLSRLPKAPDADHSYKPSWSYNEFDNWIVTFNHEQILNDNVTAFFNAGYHREDWYGYIDGSPKILNLNGDYSINESNYPLAVTTKYAQIGVKGKFETGKVTHDYVLGVDRMWYDNYGGEDPNWGNGGTVKVTGNVYSKILNDLAYANANHKEGRAPWSQTQQVTGWHLVDDLGFMDGKLDVILGIHGHRDTQSKRGVADKTYDGVIPTYGINYKFTDDFSMYASHTEQFSLGKVVGSQYKNKGEALDPTKAKQNEFGFKYKTGNTLHTLSFYEIKQANYNETPDNYYREYGKQKDKGIEYTVSGAINDKLDIIGGVSYVDAKQALNGKRVNGVPHWSGTLGLIYKPTDNLNFIGRMTYLGRTPIQNEKLEAPSHTIFDIGANYETKINQTPVTFQAMLYNVFDKNYWSGMNASNSLTLGQPRTFVFSATLHL